MKQAPIKLGPLALLLAVISICLTTLSILTLSTAMADLRLAEKYAQTVERRYALETQGQEFLLTLSGPEGLERDEDGILWKTLERSGAQLRIGLVPEGDGYRVVAWRQETVWNQDTGLGNLWTGN